MSKKQVLAVDFAVASVAIAGCLFLWGWMYWSYNLGYFGVPETYVNNLGIERIIAAGSAFLAFFAFRFSLLILVLWLLIRSAIFGYASLQPRLGIRTQAIAMRVGNLASSPFSFVPLTILCLGIAYDWSLSYVKHDAWKGAEERVNKPWTRADIKLKESELKSEGTVNYDLLGQSGDFYYVLWTDRTNPSDLLFGTYVVSKDEVRSIKARSTENDPRTKSLKAKNKGP